MGERRHRSGPDFSRERAALRGGARRVAGIDEAGRGPLAGPVVAAAVILDPDAVPPGLDDSKKLGPARREALFEAICVRAQVSLAIADVDRIDRDNILNATLWAMAAAVAGLDRPPDLALVDGNRLPQLGCPAQAVIGGDGASLSIAAASIVAKVTRDRLMTDLDRHYPHYGFARHKGYGTSLHLAALERHGPCAEHRRSFAPVARVMARHTNGMNV